MDETAHKRVGDLLRGKYQLEALLGSGGMGDVYRATHTRLGRPVAVKVLRPEGVHDAELVERFLQEGRAAYHVRHPNVVEVIDVDTDEDGVPFIVLEYLEGQDLGSVVTERGRISPEEAIEILEPIARAVGEAHRKGLVHRDLKPDNVFLARTGESLTPKLVDFGISKLEAPSDPKRTLVPMLVGTPPYMAPEQISAPDSVDARTDVWGLGVVLYEVLSGRLPFEGETITAIFTKICFDDPVPLEDLVSACPASLLAIVRRCLSKDPALRFETCTELAGALAAVGKKTVAAPRAAPRWLTPKPMVPVGWGDLEVAKAPVVPSRAPRPPLRLEPEFVKSYDASELVPDLSRRPPRPSVRSRPPVTPRIAPHDASIADLASGALLGALVSFASVRADWMVSRAREDGGNLVIAGAALGAVLVLGFVLASLGSLAMRKGSAPLGLASVGLLGFTASIAFTALSIVLPRLSFANDAAEIAPMALPISGVAVTLGLSVHAGRRALEALRSDDAPTKNFGVAFALSSFVGFVATLFVGYQAFAAFAS
jgi:serine/threonine protein kinase